MPLSSHSLSFFKDFKKKKKNLKEESNISQTHSSKGICRSDME